MLRSLEKDNLQVVCQKHWCRSQAGGVKRPEFQQYGSPHRRHRTLLGDTAGLRPAGLSTCTCRLPGDADGGAADPSLARAAEGGSELEEARSRLVASANGDPRPAPPPNESLPRQGGSVGAMWDKHLAP